MQFRLIVPEGKSSLEFNKYLLRLLIDNILNNIDRSQYELIDSQVREYTNIANESFSTYNLIKHYVNTFSIKDAGEYVYIGDNNNERLLGSDKLVSDVIRLCEYGYMRMRPTPRISSVINRIQSNLDDIYNNWIEVNGTKK